MDEKVQIGVLGCEESWGTNRSSITWESEVCTFRLPGGVGVGLSDMDLSGVSILRQDYYYISCLDKPTPFKHYDKTPTRNKRPHTKSAHYE